MTRAVQFLVLLTGLLLPGRVQAQGERIEAETIARIREEGLRRSQAMEHVIWLSDIYGPRLTGSPAIEEAGAWAMAQLASWGLANVRQERFPFGKGWTLERFSAHLLEPQVQPLIGYPKSWTSGTGGPVTAEVVLAPIETAADFERYRGRLRGRIVLTQPARAVRMLDGRIVMRMNEQDIAEVVSEPEAAVTSGPGAATFADLARMQQLQRRIPEFYAEEGVIATFDRGADTDEATGYSGMSWVSQRVDGGTVFVGVGGARDSTAGRGLPSVTLAVEHYNRMVRVLERGVPVRVELDVRTRFHEEERPNAFNILAEIPGTDPRLKDEVVILGAHFDSHHAGTGATDNASGSASMMEAMRILKAVGVQPRRTIRLALWGAEEQGLLGSRHYARTHLADRMSGTLKPEHGKVSVYFNIDNGTGRIRGVWMQQNPEVRPIFEQWLEPLKDLGVDLLGPRAVGSTDHMAFEDVGVPGFQFIQERLEYGSRTHHSSMDVVDRVQREDVEHNAVVAAVFALLAAQRDEMLPRKPLPFAPGPR